MQIEINTAEGVERSAALDGHIEKALGQVERRFGDRLTRVLVFLKDESPSKGGVDKTCRMEARPAGRDPLTVHAVTDDAYTAVRQAADKLERALARRLARGA